MQLPLATLHEPPLPPLSNPHHEAFAIARAEGDMQAAAYVKAGFAASDSGGSRLEAKEFIRERIAELIQRRERFRRAGVEETIIDLMAMADGAGALNSGAALKEARIARLEANRLWTLLDQQRDQEPQWKSRPSLSTDEWLAKYGPGGPGHTG